jgi:hypothetical protein
MISNSYENFVSRFDLNLDSLKLDILKIRTYRSDINKEVTIILLKSVNARLIILDTDFLRACLTSSFPSTLRSPCIDQFPIFSSQKDFSMPPMSCN